MLSEVTFRNASGCRNKRFSRQERREETSREEGGHTSGQEKSIDVIVRRLEVGDRGGKEGMDGGSREGKVRRPECGQSVGVNLETSLHPPHSTQRRPVKAGRKETAPQYPTFSESVPTSSISIPKELPPEA